MTRNWIGSNN